MSAQITVETINAALATGAKSLTAISKALGFKGSVSGSIAKKIRELVPDIEARLKAKQATPAAPAENAETPKPKSAKAKKVKTVMTAQPKQPKGKKANGTAKTPKNTNGNPYRPGSSYAVCFDCLAKMGKAKPVLRKDLLAAYAKASGKDEKRAGYDLAVILSPSKDGEGHRSSQKTAYFVERLSNGLVKLHMLN